MERITLLGGGRGGRGGAGEVQKKYSRKENFNEKKNSCTPINPNKYSCYGLKLKFTKEFDKEKKFPRLKIPPPP